MLEPLLVAGGEPKWIDTANPDVKAAVIRTEKAVLVLPVWMGVGSQYVPGQAAVAELKILVPQVPPGMQPWEVSPGYVRSLRWERTTGGVEVRLPEFSLTGAIVFTSDPGNPAGLVPRFQEQQRRMCKVAAQWSHDQAEEEIAKVEHVYEQLDQGGHALPDGKELLKKAHGFLDSCETLRRNGDYTEAYLEAQRALRPLRILMRGAWEKAVKGLDNTPVASPYALSYYTLPRHWEFWQEVQQRRAGSNVLPDGDFEAANDQAPEGWVMEEVPSLDDVTVSAKRVKDDPKVGKQCLLVEIKPKDGTKPPVVLERTYLAIHSPAVRLLPGTLVKISAWVKIPDEIGASTDGALFFDSVGGEPLALRMTAKTGWKQYVVYRKVPASGTINVTMALQGLGKVYFDDVRIEPLVAR
jgi:hypothetical protein